MRRFLRRQAMEHGRLVRLWKRYGKPDLHEWAEYLRRHGGFHAFGENCAISPETHFGDRHLISIGSNVRIAGAWMTCHDGSVNMLNRALGLKLDSVGPIVIGDNVFIGYGSIVLPNVTIGSNVIIAAGSVVSRDVPGDCVAAGVPAKKVADLGAYVEKLKQRNAGYPWQPLIEQRAGDYDPSLEPTLRRQRVAHFFG